MDTDSSTTSLCRVVDTILLSLRELSADPNNVVVVISGCQKHKMFASFGDTDAWLAAENGVYLRPPKAVRDRLHVEARPFLSLPVLCPCARQWCLLCVCLAGS